MNEKISRILKSEMTTSVFYIFLGLCLIVAPVQTVNVICKIIFGLSLIASGGYQLFTFLKGKQDATVFNMFSGVIVLVFGIFLFTNPQIVVRPLPVLIGALLLVDSIWLLRTGFLLKKRNHNLWTAYIAGAAIGIILAVIIMLNPFARVRSTILFSGIILLINGIADIVFFMLRKKNLTSDGENTVPANTVHSDKNSTDDTDMYDEYDPSYKKETEHLHFGDPVVEEEHHFGNPPEQDGNSEWNSQKGGNGSDAPASVSQEKTPSDSSSYIGSSYIDSSYNGSSYTGSSDEEVNRQEDDQKERSSDPQETEPVREEPPKPAKKEDGFERPGESEWKF